jgi:ornithine carbamoyltransferase
MTEDFLAIPDFTRDELYGLFALAEKMREGKYTDKPLAGKSLAMIFMKASTRTRVSFEVGTYQLGGHALFLSPRDVQLGRGEPIADTARVLSRYVDGIMIRTFAHQDIEELAKFADVPVINGLTDMLHPCQILADLLTVREHMGGKIEDKRYAWIGDGNNMANSWINAAYRFGFELTLACPEGYEPADHLLARAQQSGAKVKVVRDPMEAAAGAHVINTDVWASMGQEEEQKKREKDFKGYSVTPAMMKKAAKDAIFLHCLPAHRGEEVAAEVIDGPQSRVWDEAENRLHIQKAIMAVLMGGVKP